MVPAADQACVIDFRQLADGDLAVVQLGACGEELQADLVSDGQIDLVTAEGCRTEEPSENRSDEAANTMHAEDVEGVVVAEFAL